MFNGIGIDDDVLNSGMHFGNLHDLPDLVNKVGGKHSHDLNQMLDSELSDVWSFSVWQEIINLQSSFNDSVSPGWEKDINQEQYNTWYALLDEVTEVVNSKEWKWWKNSADYNSVDWDNVVVEFVDIFHFMLSLALQTDSADTIFVTMVSFQKSKSVGKNDTKIREDDFFEHFWDKILMSVFLKQTTLLMVSWVELWYKLGEDLNSFTKAYFTKMALNKIRQEFGYSNNTYFKMWSDPKNPSDIKQKVEDNVAAKYLMRNIKDDDIRTDTIKEMEHILRNYYLEFVAI